MGSKEQKSSLMQTSEDKIGGQILHKIRNQLYWLSAKNVKNYFRSKIDIDETNTENIMEINYLVIKLVLNRKKIRIHKANTAAVFINNTTGTNRLIRIETKKRIYKATIKPVIT